MRRPIVFILLAFSLGILLAAKSLFTVILIAFSGVIIFIFQNNFINSCMKINMNKVIWSYTFIGFVLFGAFLLNIHNIQNPNTKALIGETITLTGQTQAVYEKDNDYNQLVVDAKYIDYASKRIMTSERILVKLYGPIKSIENNLIHFKLQDITGREVQITGKITLPPGLKNPRLFNYREFLKTKNINYIVEAKTFQCNVQDGSVNYFINILSNFKFEFSQRLKNLINKDSYALFIGILFGDTNLLEEDIYDIFQKNGTAHILSVSGIHVAIIYACIEKLIPNKNSIPYNILAIFILFCYSALSLFSPSVLRAFFMISVYIIGKLIYQRYDLTSSTAFTGLILLIYNPFYLFSLGFQLSYLAVFVLAVLLPFINIKLKENGISENLIEDRTISLDNWRNFAKRILFYMLPLIAIQIGMIPITAYIFNYFSLSAFITNAPVIIISAALLPIGLLMMVLEIINIFTNYLNDLLIIYNIFAPITNFLDFINEILFSIAALSSQILIELMIWINKLTAVKNIGYFSVESPSAIIVAVYYILLFIICCEMGQYILSKINSNYRYENIIVNLKVFELRKIKKSREISLSVLGLIVILLIIILFPSTKYSQAELTFIDVGQGDSIHIRTQNGKNILIDGGGSRAFENGGSGYDVGGKILLPYLLKNNVGKIDMAIVTHIHDDHFAGIASLSKLINIDKLVLYEGNRGKEEEILKQVNISKDKIFYVGYPNKILVEEGIFIDVIYPNLLLEENVEEIDENQMNLVLKINYRGTTALITGDLTSEDEEKIINMNTNLNSDIIKIAHHGSKYSTSQKFLDKVNPSIGIIQVGKNNFGHPSPIVLDKLEAMNINLFRTDIDGAILFDIEDGMIQNVLTMKVNKWQKWTRRIDE